MSPGPATPAAASPDLKVIGNRKMAESIAAHVQAREFRTMAKGAAVACKVVPDALLRAGLVDVPPGLEDVVKANLARLVELAADRAADVVARLDHHAVAAEARAAALEEVARELLGEPPRAPGAPSIAEAVLATPPPVGQDAIAPDAPVA